MVQENITQQTQTTTLHILIDTCVWLDLAKQTDGTKMVSMMRELSSSHKVELLVPSVILDEFKRNRDKVQAMMTRNIGARFREVRKAIDEHGRDKSKKRVLEELDNITHQVPIINELATQTFETILELMHSGKIVEPTALTKVSAVERALAKQAPFHREKNSVADALIIEMYGQAAKKATPSNRYCFVTHNVKDFSNVNGDERLPHSDLQKFFSNPYSQYFTNLKSALTEHLPEEIAELDFEFDFDEEPRPLGEVLPYLNQLHDQIWYNRHKNHEYRIGTGEITLVENWDKKNASTTTTRGIWKDAQKAAKQVEEKYGVDQLGPWDDFEWGMLNGKMSAIRWMLGEDWESTLDT